MFKTNMYLPPSGRTLFGLAPDGKFGVCSVWFVFSDGDSLRQWANEYCLTLKHLHGIDTEKHQSTTAAKWLRRKR